MKLVIKKVLDYEMIHFASEDLFIASKGNIVFYNDKIIEIPDDISRVQKFARKFRKGRRLFRLDKTIVYPLGANIIIVRGGRVLHYDLKTDKLSEILKIACRNPMYLGITATEDGVLFLGEYGRKSSIGKRIFKSTDKGLSWNCIYTFKIDEITHIHCIAWDSFDKKIWVFTGDYNGECKVICTDENFSKLQYIGDGSQRYRTCHALFSEDYVDWVMDSPLETVKHIRYIRKTGEVVEGQKFAGPVWFAKRLSKGITVAASAQEIGPSHTDKYLHLYASKDMKNWQELKLFEHDRWPKSYFRFGTITFARGNSTDNSFYIFCEGVKGLDGKSALCYIVN